MDGHECSLLHPQGTTSSKMILMQCLSTFTYVITCLGLPLGVLLGWEAVGTVSTVKLGSAYLFEAHNSVHL